MNTKIRQLRDLVVALDRYDRKLDAVDAAAYQAAAARALPLTHEEMGLLPMSDFAGPVSALQNMAENIHFAAHGRFADLDGTGSADAASAVATALLKRRVGGADASVREVSDSLLARLGIHSSGSHRLSRP
jgi:hypothetical protein